MQVALYTGCFIYSLLYIQFALYTGCLIYRLPYIQVALYTGFTDIQEGTNITAIYSAHLKGEPVCEVYKHTYRIYFHNKYFIYIYI
jgi:hypothetical protein